MNFIKVDLPAPAFPQTQKVPLPDSSQVVKEELGPSDVERELWFGKTHLNVDLCAARISSCRYDLDLKFRLSRKICSRAVTIRSFSVKLSWEIIFSRMLRSVG